MLFLVACGAPVGTTSLLSSGGSSTTPSTSTGSEETGELDIRADNQELTVNVEDNDKVEITGSCSDLNRKKNRIIVEVFSGEGDAENGNPYISNAISDKCLPAVGAFTGNGTIVGTPCFWVSKGVGLIEELGLPTQRPFPQCHNGRFGFSVRLGAVLTTPAPSGSRYTVRFKIRTQEGIISESEWSRVFITRKLSIPVIDDVKANQNEYSCTLEMSPARFNQNITYDLSRVQTGTNIATGSGTVSSTTQALFTGVVGLRISSQLITPGISAYNFVSNPNTSLHPVIAGMSYVYTLNSLEATNYAAGGFAYPAPLQQSFTSPKTCVINPQKIELTPGLPPQNTPVAIGGTGPTCFLRFEGGGINGSRPQNPQLGGAVLLDWGFATTSNWTGVNKDGAPAGIVGQANGQFCSSSIFCNASEVNSGLAANTTYYFAVRERAAGSGQLGKWSQEVACTTPAPSQ
jgi:hypothetical protein